MKFFAQPTTEAAKIIKEGGVAVVPTDTIYGIVGSARNQKAIERIYELKGRDNDKPFIILVSSIMEVEEFGVRLSKKEKEILAQNWPGPVSIILDASAPDYLTRGLSGLAFRLPADPQILNLIKRTGPLVAPSANPQGEKPAQNIKEAVEYFNEEVDFYIDGGEIDREPSRLISIKDGNVKIIRP